MIMKKIYCEPKTVIVNITINNLMQAASGEVVVPVEGEQSNEEALGRRRSVWDDEDDVDDDW